jgi:hypothetical protein
MSKFDQIFESAMYALREQTQRPNDDLEFNIRTLVLKLQDPINGYVGKDRSAEEITREIIQNKNVLDIGADELNYLPKIRLQFSQSSGVEDFNVEASVLVTNNNAISEKNKKFTGNEAPESICDNVIAFIDKVKMETMSGDAGVKTLPGEEGANAQPGNDGETALPVAANTPSAQGAQPSAQQQPSNF